MTSCTYSTTHHFLGPPSLVFSHPAIQISVPSAIRIDVRSSHAQVPSIMLKLVGTFATYAVTCRLSGTERQASNIKLTAAANENGCAASRLVVPPIAAR